MSESSWRTTRDLVAGIIETDPQIVLSDETGLDPFIDTANDLVTRLCTNSNYSDNTLELIERWLSAHFYAVRDPRTTTEGAGGVSAGYESRVDLGLNLTRYGQQAMLVDSDNNLAALNKRNQEGVPPRPGVIWLGRRRRGGRCS